MTTVTNSLRGILLLLLILLFLPWPSLAREMNSHYATLIYKDEGELSEFNRRALKNVLYHEKGYPLSDEVTGKLDILVEKVVMILLRTWPTEHLKFKIVLLRSDSDIRKLYSEKYGNRKDYVAFYSPKDDTVFLSMGDLRPGILAHEIAHVIISHYFHHAASGVAHEALAELVERYIDE